MEELQHVLGISGEGLWSDSDEGFQIFPSLGCQAPQSGPVFQDYKDRLRGDILCDLGTDSFTSASLQAPVYITSPLAGCSPFKEERACCPLLLYQAQQAAPSHRGSNYGLGATPVLGRG